MGYSIYIGEAVLEVYEDELAACFTVEKTENENAPFWESIADPLPDASGKTNGRFPPYGVIDQWSKTVGLYDLFFNKEDGFLCEHPGIKEINKDHLLAIRRALAEYKELHPNAEPGWMDGKDAKLARLIWFEWWFEWAIENCKRPAICNH